MPPDTIATLTDQAILEQLGAYIVQQRLAANLTQAQLASQAGVSKRTLERAESGQSIQLTTFIRLLRELGLLATLEQWFPSSSPSPIQQLAQQRGRYKSNKKSRVRATASAKKTTKQSWEWGEDS